MHLETKPAYPWCVTGYRCCAGILGCLWASLPCFLPFQSVWAEGLSKPIEIRERLWEEGLRTVRDTDGSPRLMVVYPSRDMGSTSHKETRYAGRVDPPDTLVKLNGKEIQVYNGGVFTGLHPLPDKGEVTWKFVAIREDRQIVVERKLSRKPGVPPTMRWPLEFHKNAVWPNGDFILPSDQSLNVILFASRGHQASYRLGETGLWKMMKPGRVDEKRGGCYQASIHPPKPRDYNDGVPQLLQVWFRLEGMESNSGKEGSLKTVTRKSSLSIGNMAGLQAVARTTRDHNSFLKNRTSWERYGNWSSQTWFPVRGVYDDRIMVDFGVGETGWIELANADIHWGQDIVPLPDLDEPVLHHEPDRIVLGWPALEYPLAYVLRQEIIGENISRLLISFPGAGEVSGLSVKLTHESPAHAYRLGRPCSVDGRKSSPRLELDLKSKIWGYRIRQDNYRGMGLVVRIPPSLPVGNERQPLKGLRVMIDAGHGGHDDGAIGPSGLTEADLNRVQSVWLEKILEGLGSRVIQTRMDDTFIGLNQRIREVELQDPDLFVSLHHNSVSLDRDPLIDRGPLVFYHYDHAQRFAEEVALELNQLLLPGKSPRIRRQNFRVIRNISFCPSILVETAYVCHPDDEWLLRQDETHQKTAAAIAAGIRNLVEPGRVFPAGSPYNP